MGLLTINTKDFNKVFKNIVIEGSDEPRIRGFSTYVPNTDNFGTPEYLPVKRLFYVERNLKCDNLSVPEATLGRVYVAESLNRQLFPTAVVLVPLDRRTRKFGLTEVDLERSANDDTNTFCRKAVAQALVAMTERPFVELAGVPTS